MSRLVVEGAEVRFLSLEHSPGDWASAEERAIAARYARPELAARYLASRAHLRGVLAEYLQIDPTSLRFEKAPGGKPRLAAPCAPLFFNLSHSDTSMALAISSDREVGIDLEKIRPQIDLDALAKTCLTESEMRILGEGEKGGEGRLERFYRFWTMKEAVLKAHGLGLSRVLRELEVSLGPEPRARFLTGDDLASETTLRELPTAPSGFRAALALAFPSKISFV
jgi:4'-phosphopantetheinyl transferase